MSVMVQKLVVSDDPLSVVDINVRPWTGTPDTRIRLDDVLDSKHKVYEYPTELSSEGKMLFGITTQQQALLLQLLHTAYKESDSRKSEEIKSMIETLTGKSMNHDEEER